MLLFRAVKLVFSALVTTSTLNAKVTENKSKMPDCVHFVGTPEFDKLESKKKNKRSNIKWFKLDYFSGNVILMTMDHKIIWFLSVYRCFKVNAYNYFCLFVFRGGGGE